MHQIGTVALSDGSDPAIAYGTEALAPSTARAMRSGDTTGLNRAGSPFVTLSRRFKTLRMSDQIHVLGQPAKYADLAHADGQLTLLKGHLEGLCGPWNKPLTAFLSAYFAAVRTKIASEAGMIAAITGDLAGLVEPLHWAFAAPLPMPRAHLPLGDDPGRTERVDMAFWVRGTLMALVLGSGTPTPAARTRHDQLLQSGIRVTSLTRADISEPDTLLDRLGDGFVDFLHGVDLPSGPFRGTPLSSPETALRTLA